MLVNTLTNEPYYKVLSNTFY